MIDVLAVTNFRSILDLQVPLGSLNLVTGANGVGKSNLYRSLHLLSACAQGGIVNSLARDGGFCSTYWAGPPVISRAMKNGTVPIQGVRTTKPKRLKLGFSCEDLSYAISLGLRPADPCDPTLFKLDPDIKRECIWAGPICKPSAMLVDRRGVLVQTRNESGVWDIIDKDMNPFDSIFDRFLNMDRCPEIFYLRENIRNWRFYDYFRTDKDAPARQSQIGTFTPILNHDGSDVAAAIQTVMENGIMENLVSTIEDAFPGARLEVQAEQGRFSLFFHQPGLLRPLTVSELSEGTLRYILLVAALLTPRPPELMVLNEPETSLHPDLIPALARLIIKASKESQIWVISHSKVLIKQLTKYKHCKHLELEKELGATLLKGQNLLDKPQWKWPVKS